MKTIKLLQWLDQKRWAALVIVVLSLLLYLGSRWPEVEIEPAREDSSIEGQRQRMLDQLSDREGSIAAQELTQPIADRTARPTRSVLVRNGSREAAYSEGWTLQGRIIDESDEPISGAKIGLHPARPSGEGGLFPTLDGPVSTAFSGWQGLFELRVEEPDSRLWILVSKPGHTSVQKPLAEQPGQTKTYRLARKDALLQGQVRVADTGLPIADASICLEQKGSGTGMLAAPLRTRSAGDGRFEIRFSLSQLPLLALKVRASGYLTFQDYLSEVHHPGRETIVSMTSGRAGALTAFDRSGKEILRAEVALQFKNLFGQSRLEVFGADQQSGGIQYLLPPSPAFAEVRANGYLSKRFEVGPRQQLPKRVQLDPATNLTAVVFSESGEPLEGAEIFSRTLPLPGLQPDYITDVQGRFRLKWPSFGSISLWIRCRGFATSHRSFIVQEGDREPLQFFLRPAAAKVAGRVLLPSGFPAQSFQLGLNNLDDLTQMMLVRSFQNPDGFFTVDHLPDGLYSISAVQQIGDVTLRASLDEVEIFAGKENEEMVLLKLAEDGSE